MSFKLLLTNKAFPNNFSNIATPKEVLEDQKISWVEQKIIGAINQKNYKLKIENIEYCDIPARFPDFLDSNYAGLIVEEFTISLEMEEYYRSRNYFVYSCDDIVFAQRPWIYIMTTSVTEPGRNVFVSQSIFPTLIDYMSKFLKTSCYEVANHPIYFLNIVKKQVTAQTIMKQIHALALMNVCYIDVFNSTPNVSKKTFTLKKYVLTFDPSSYDEEHQLYTSAKFDLDFKNKKLKIKTQDLTTEGYLVQGSSYIDFKGSSEKFYWMEMLPVTIKAFEENFDIDYDDFKTFCQRKAEFSPNSSKFSRFETILSFIRKLNLED